VKQGLIIYERGRKEVGAGRPADHRPQTTDSRPQTAGQQTIDNRQLELGTWNLEPGTRAKPG